MQLFFEIQGIFIRYNCCSKNQMRKRGITRNAFHDVKLCPRRSIGPKIRKSTRKCLLLRVTVPRVAVVLGISSDREGRF